MIHLIIEISIFILFMFTAFFAWKIKKLDFLIYALIFATLFENLNVILFRGLQGAYTYSPDFAVNIFHTPLFIILSWGIILLGSYSMAQALGLSKKQKLSFIPISVLLIDLIIESLSVMQGFWIWEGFNYGGILGNVFPGNYVGWLGVTLGFILVYEYSKLKWLSSFLGYFVFFALSVLGYTISKVFSLTGILGHLSAGLILLGFIIAYVSNTKQHKKNSVQKEHYYLILTRYIFFIGGFLIHLKEKFFFDFTLTVFILIAISFDLTHWIIIFKRQKSLRNLFNKNKPNRNKINKEINNKRIIKNHKNKKTHKK